MKRLDSLFKFNAFSISVNPSLDEPEPPGRAGALHSHVAERWEATADVALRQQDGQSLSDHGVHKLGAAGVLLAGTVPVTAETGHDGVNEVVGQQLIDGDLDSSQTAVAVHGLLSWGSTPRATGPLSLSVEVAWPQPGANLHPECWQLRLTLGDIFRSGAEGSGEDLCLGGHALRGGQVGGGSTNHSLAVRAGVHGSSSSQQAGEAQDHLHVGRSKCKSPCTLR